MGDKKNKAIKFTKLYCLRKDGMYVAWDGKSMTEKPHEGIRLSKTLCERLYKGYEMIPFVEAYDEWFRDRQAAKA